MLYNINCGAFLVTLWRNHNNHTDTTRYICFVEVKLDIAKESVLEEIYRLTGYTGLKGGDISHVSSSSDDEALLSSYLDEAAGQLGEVLGQNGYVSQQKDNAQKEIYVIILQLPANWKSEVKDSLAKACKQYLYNYTCMQWFSLTKREDVTHYAELLNAASPVIRRLLCERINTRRRTN